MAPSRREGLRVRLLERLSPKKPSKTNAQRCKEYREKLKADALKAEAYQLQYLERNRQNRLKPKTPEEQQRRKEQNRVRQQKHRDKLKAQSLGANPSRPTDREAGVTPVITRHQQQTTQAAIEERRGKWRKYKRDEREKWRSQKKRRNRERARDWYHKNKSIKRSDLDATDAAGREQLLTTGDNLQNPISGAPETTKTSNDANATPVAVPVTSGTTAPETARPTKEGERKAVCRAKKAISKLSKNAFEKLFQFMVKKTGHQSKDESASPSAKMIKENVLGELENLKSKRSKESLSARRLLFDAVEGQATSSSNTNTKEKRRTKTQKVSRNFLMMAVYIFLAKKLF